jgi:hypothetical protein
MLTTVPRVVFSNVGMGGFFLRGKWSLCEDKGADGARCEAALPRREWIH